MIIAAACGTLAGYRLAHYIAIRVIESGLDQSASRMMAHEDATSLGLRNVLASVGASPFRRCSNAEIDYFRKLIFASENLKDAGRMRNGKIECSAALGRPAQPSGQSTPDFVQADGSILYTKLVPYQNDGLTTITLQLGGSFVVFTPLPSSSSGPVPMHYTETVTDSPTHTYGKLLGESLQVAAPILTTEGRARIGDSLYATRCSPHFFNCVTAYATMPEVMQANRVKSIVFIALFRLLGGLAGLVLSLQYHRYQSLDHRLRRAIRSDKLFLVYQPIVQLPSRRIEGAEALVRWNDKHCLAIAPDVFIPIAEEQGFVGAITRLVVRHALRDFGETLRSHPEFRLSINAAASDLADPGFLPMLSRSLADAAVPARSLTIEITERSSVISPASIETIRGLRERGHSVHIDDFGTGYSSLSYLHNLSVDAIKIDKAFTHAIGTGAVIVAILPQILAMAEALNLQVIVEGVETEEQAIYFASAAQPVLAQGWLFGHPVRAGEFQCLLAEDQTKTAESKNVPAAIATAQPISVA
jgi:sensor c-di-GMP phosphodiesterase-like protein